MKSVLLLLCHNVLVEGMLALHARSLVTWMIEGAKYVYSVVKIINSTNLN